MLLVQRELSKKIALQLTINFVVLHLINNFYSKEVEDTPVNCVPSIKLDNIITALDDRNKIKIILKTGAMD